MAGACVVGICSTLPSLWASLTGSLIGSQMLPALWHAPLNKKSMLHCCLWPHAIGAALLWLLSPSPVPHDCHMTLSDTSGHATPLLTKAPRILLLWRDDCQLCRKALTALSQRHGTDTAHIAAVNQGQSLVQVLRVNPSMPMWLDPHQSLGARTAIQRLPALVFLDRTGQCTVPYQGVDVLSAHAFQKISRVLDEASRASR